MKLYESIVLEVQKALPENEDAARFVSRQCRYHLKVEPHDLTVAHIRELAKWIWISSSLLIAKEQGIVLRKNIEALSAETAYV